jgi:membrane protease YdiL (CAAX protease family)
MGIPVAGGLLATSAALLRLEGRDLGTLGLRLAPRLALHVLCGLIAGLLLLAIGALALRGVLPFVWRLNPHVLPAAILNSLLFALITNTCEELAWRGYAFDGLVRHFGPWPAQAIVALTAAGFHVLSGWPWAVALTSTTAGSVLFGLTFLRFRSLPAAVGVHVGWNWGRGLLLSEDSPASVWEPLGMKAWSPSELSVAQAVLILVTIVACVGLARFGEGVPESRS